MTAEQKENYKKAIIPDMMSSDEEHFDDDGNRLFQTKIPQWRTRKFQKLIDLADKSYMDSCSNRSKEQMVKRVKGSPSKRPPPSKLDYGFDIFINKTV